MLIFLCIQTVIYGTSRWVKSLMQIHSVLMFISPFKFKQLNFKGFLSVRFVCTTLLNTNFKASIVQEYWLEMPLKIIEDKEKIFV